jgi:hypothetical protein
VDHWGRPKWRIFEETDLRNPNLEGWLAAQYLTRPRFNSVVRGVRVAGQSFHSKCVLAAVANTGLWKVASNFPGSTRDASRNRHIQAIHALTHGNRNKKPVDQM